MKLSIKPLLLLALALVALVSAGCATTSEENVSERPWNSPKGWEHGMPSSLYDQR